VEDRRSGLQGFLRRALSNSFPLLNIIENRAKRAHLFLRGIKGVSIANQPDANNTPKGYFHGSLFIFN
jgi:hypothetical protein